MFLFGGITYSEIAAIRYLNKELKFIKFIILTTHIITTKRFFDNVNTFSLDINQQMTLKEFYEMKFNKK